MILISQNLTRYSHVSADAVIRINLAWIDNINVLKSQLEEISNSIFMDLPIGRTKPPNNSYTVEEIRELVLEYPNVKYLAISNVESQSHIKKYINIFRDSLTIVPKIETLAAIENIAEIVEALDKEKIMMLDHEDLFTDLFQKNIPPSDFFDYIDILTNYCNKTSTKLLRMRGVIFSDEDMYYYKK